MASTVYNILSSNSHCNFKGGSSLPPRWQVILATLPITRCLVDGACIAEGEDAMVLALNQLSELAQVIRTHKGDIRCF